CYAFLSFYSVPTRRSSDLAQHDDKEGCRLEQRQGNAPEHLKRTGTVNYCRFVQFARDVHKARIEVENINARPAPRRHQNKRWQRDRKSTRLNSSHVKNSYA